MNQIECKENKTGSKKDMRLNNSIFTLSDLEFSNIRQRKKIAKTPSFCNNFTAKAERGKPFH